VCLQQNPAHVTALFRKSQVLRALNRLEVSWRGTPPQQRPPDTPPGDGRRPTPPPPAPGALTRPPPPPLSQDAKACLDTAASHADPATDLAVIMDIQVCWGRIAALDSGEPRRPLGLHRLAPTCNAHLAPACWASPASPGFRPLAPGCRAGRGGQQCGRQPMRSALPVQEALTALGGSVQGGAAPAAAASAAPAPQEGRSPAPAPLAVNGTGTPPARGVGGEAPAAGGKAAAGAGSPPTTSAAAAATTHASSPAPAEGSCSTSASASSSAGPSAGPSTGPSTSSSQSSTHNKPKSAGKGFNFAAAAAAGTAKASPVSNGTISSSRSTPAAGGNTCCSPPLRTSASAASRLPTAFLVRAAAAPRSAPPSRLPTAVLSRVAAGSAPEAVEEIDCAAQQESTHNAGGEAGAASAAGGRPRSADYNSIALGLAVQMVRALGGRDRGVAGLLAATALPWGWRCGWCAPQGGCAAGGGGAAAPRPPRSADQCRRRQAAGS